MIRVLFALGLSMTCAASLACAADLPLLIVEKAPIHHKTKIVQRKAFALPGKKLAILAKKAGHKQQLAVVLPAATMPAPAIKPPALPSAMTNLSWVLGPMVANADGGKNEGSASATGNLVVDRPGASYGPEMVIELDGHVVKTVQSTVRLDIHIGPFQKSLVWSADEIKSGIFKITLTEKAPAGVLPAYIPVTALAFVTKVGDGHAAMVSLEKIVVRLGNAQIISAK